MKKLAFFDANASVGRIGHPHLLDIPDAAGLEKEMARAGIEEALVYHLMSVHGDAPLGKSMLLKEIEGHANLVPAWVVLPHHTGEMPKPKELLARMKDKGVRAARMYPTRAMHNFSLEEWCAGDLLDALEEKRVPLMLDTEIVSWEDVHGVLKNHPKLPVIMTNCTYRFNRYLYPMFEKFENLRVEMSRFMGQCCIEDVVARFGARPLVFGTNLPQYTGTAAVGRLTYADIEWTDKEAIASGNLKAMLKESWR